MHQSWKEKPPFMLIVATPTNQRLDRRQRRRPHCLCPLVKADKTGQSGSRVRAAPKVPSHVEYASGESRTAETQQASPAACPCLELSCPADTTATMEAEVRGYPREEMQVTAELKVSSLSKYNGIRWACKMTSCVRTCPRLREILRKLKPSRDPPRVVDCHASLRDQRVRQVC